jgi:hypothetical protein
MDFIEKINQLLDPLSESKSLKGSLPKPWGVLYAHPNPDGSRKSCANCATWIKDLKQCDYHASNIMVTKDHICGYHVWGKPHDGRLFEDIQYVDPQFSGLELVSGGTSCDICEYYRKTHSDGGICRVAQVDGKHAKVDALGCCARFESK